MLLEEELLDEELGRAGFVLGLALALDAAFGVGSGGLACALALAPTWLAGRALGWEVDADALLLAAALALLRALLFALGLAKSAKMMSPSRSCAAEAGERPRDAAEGGPGPLFGVACAGMERDWRPEVGDGSGAAATVAVIAATDAATGAAVVEAAAKEGELGTDGA